MRVSTIESVSFFENLNLLKKPEIYSDERIDVSKCSLGPLLSFAILVYDTEQNCITRESAAKFVNETTAAADGSIEKISPLALSYVLKQYAAYKSYGSKKMAPASVFTSRPVIGQFCRARPRTLKFHNTQNKCKGPFKPHDSKLNEEAKEFHISYCLSCWRKMKEITKTWFSLFSVKQFSDERFYATCIAPLERPGAWYSVLGACIRTSGTWADFESLGRRYWLSPIPVQLAEKASKHVPWADIAGHKDALGANIIMKSTSEHSAQTLVSLGSEIASSGFATTPNIFAIRHVLTTIGSNRNLLTGVGLFRTGNQTSDKCIIATRAFRAVMAFLFQSAPEITIGLTAPWFAVRPFASNVVSAKNIGFQPVKEKSIICHCELLTWESLYHILFQTGSVTLLGSYSAASAGIRTSSPGIVDGYCFMYLVDTLLHTECPAKAKFLPLTEHFRASKPTTLEAHEDAVASVWPTLTEEPVPAKRRNLKLWPASPPPTLPPAPCPLLTYNITRKEIPSSRQLRVPRTSTLSAKNDVFQRKRPFTVFLSDRDTKRPNTNRL